MDFFQPEPALYKLLKLMNHRFFLQIISPDRFPDQPTPVSPVSMNMWGLQPEFFEVLETGFTEFLGNVKKEEVKAEGILP